MEIVEDEEAWVASVPDLPGCNSFGTNIDEAISGVQEAKDLWIRSQFESGGQIPEPTDEEDFSGKFVLRIPKGLHRSLYYQARKQGVSLNHYASHLLSTRHQFEALENMTHSLAYACQNANLDRWEIYGRHEHGRTMMVGKISGDLGFVLRVQKPPAQNHFKTSMTAAMRKLYQGR